jgi:uncharacterized protein YdaU (DUF1376 family)
MSRKPDVWMPFFIGDYLGDTAHLTTEQHGAYLLLLLAAWKRGGTLPNDPAQLAVITRLPLGRWKAHAAVILPFFTLADSLLVQGRLVKEYTSAVLANDAQKVNGKKGGRPKKKNPNETHGFDSGSIRLNPNESPSPSPKELQEPTVPDAGASRPDPVWGAGLAFLVRKGIPEKSARSLLGKLRQAAGDVQLGAILADCEAQDITDPAPWLMAAAANARAGPRASAPSKHLSGVAAILGVNAHDLTDQQPARTVVREIDRAESGDFVPAEPRRLPGR